MRRIARPFVSCLTFVTVISALSLTAGPVHEHALAAQVAASPATESSAAEPGSSYDTAIVLEGAKNEISGIEAEHSYITAHFPGWRQNMQSLLNQNGRFYDRIDIIGPTGETKSLHFDITDWFGKLDRIGVIAPQRRTPCVFPRR